MTIDEILGPILDMERPLSLLDSPDSIEVWDSVRQVEVVLAVEEAIGKDLGPDEIAGLTSIRAIIDLAREHGVDIEVDGGANDSAVSSG